jgi:hypothetical protein
MSIHHSLLTRLCRFATFPLYPLYAAHDIHTAIKQIKPTVITVLSDGTTRRYYNEAGECIRTWEIKPVPEQLKEIGSHILNGMIRIE